MTKLELLTLANTGYPDGFLQNYFDEKTGEEREDGSGDTLALFIVRELSETCTEDAAGPEQIEEAIVVLEMAARDLGGVIDVLRAAVEP